MPNPLDSYAGKKGSSDLKIRSLPKLSDFFRDHGLKNGIEKFDEAMEKWRQDLQRAIPSAETLTEQITQTITTVVNTSTGNSGGSSGGSGSGGGSVDLGPLTSQVSGLESDLAAHIASTVVHGTGSDVSGVTDEENLERKTIGVNFPRDARFNHAITSNQIPVGETFDVPAGTNMVVAGPFYIYGTLTVDVAGSFAIV